MSFQLAALTRSSPMRSITRSSFGVPGWLASAKPQNSRRATRSFASAFDLTRSNGGRTRSPSSEAPASCLTVKRFALLPMRKTAHLRRMVPFACLPVCGPIPSSLRGCFHTMTPVQNLLEHDNVLCIVVEFDTRRVLTPERGSLFGVIAETTPLPHAGGLIGNPPPRFDWVGRPEQTNMRLDNPGLAGADDLRDLWNQQTPFAIGDEFRPLFLQRLKDSLANWDMRDGKADWTPTALAANANMFLDDFLLFDVTKPITDTSHLEIEKSTLNGRAYETGGGRTVDANVIDVLLTWLVNRDREPLRSGTTRATKPGTKNFPYFATPNTELQSVTDRIDLNAAPDKVWALIGDFGASWHPLIANIKLIGGGIGQLRVIETIDGKQIIERLDAIDNSARFYRYTSISGIPASDYTGRLEVKPNGAGSSVEWGAQYLPKGQGDVVVRTIVSTLFKTGLESLKSRF